jgi:hypothetical protein
LTCSKQTESVSIIIAGNKLDRNRYVQIRRTKKLHLNVVGSLGIGYGLNQHQKIFAIEKLFLKKPWWWITDMMKKLLSLAEAHAAVEGHAIIQTAKIR